MGKRHCLKVMVFACLSVHCVPPRRHAVQQIAGLKSPRLPHKSVRRTTAPLLICKWVLLFQVAASVLEQCCCCCCQEYLSDGGCVACVARQAIMVKVFVLACEKCIIQEIKKEIRLLYHFNLKRTYFNIFSHASPWICCTTYEYVSCIIIFAHFSLFNVKRDDSKVITRLLHWVMYLLFSCELLNQRLSSSPFKNNLTISLFLNLYFSNHTLFYLFLPLCFPIWTQIYFKADRQG